MLRNAVRTERVNRGWSQSELARRARLSPGHINQIESGKRANPRGGVLAALAQAFGVTVDYLLEQAKKDLPPPIAQLQAEDTPDRLLHELLQVWDSLNPESAPRARAYHSTGCPILSRSR